MSALELLYGGQFASYQPNWYQSEVLHFPTDAALQCLK